MRLDIEPYLRRLGMTAGQAWTLAIGLVLATVLLTVSVPPVWDRRGPAAPTTDRPAPVASP